ncbi:MAG TPA: histidine kinase [Burkholderiaceae bacterium]|nr:histidine kinase [Burkholderiaceae bacterium]HQR70637.1 histidine kinase [Burkholderiaceae bacterium]
MAAAIALPATDVARRAGPSARTAFTRVFNLRHVAGLFYLCLLLLLGRFVIALGYEPIESWTYSLARGVRQTMISAIIMLLAIAFAEAFVASRRLTPRASITLGVVTSMLAAAVAIPVRIWVAGSPIVESIVREPAYFVQVWALWVTLGAFGYWLFHTLRTDETARAQLADAECRREGLQAQMVEARLCALQAQIEPHFLFNTLANVKRLYETAPARGREMLSSLINYLRAALPTMREPGSTLGRELELVRSFLTILQMRMGDRLRFAIDAPGGLAQARVPPMVLPTLVENAIKHGLSPLPEGGRIDIRARTDGTSQLVIEVADNGAGFSASGGSGVGLANTRSRLSALYGNDASLSLSMAAPRGVVASVRLPLQLEPTA